MQRPNCACGNRQHDSGFLHKQARGYEVRLSLCPPVEAPVLVPSQRNCSESKAHSRLLEGDSGQAFQAQSGDPNRVVPLSAGVPSFVFRVDMAPSGFVCDPVQLQTTKVCVSGSGCDSLGGRRPEPAVESVGGLRLSTVYLIPQVISKLRDQGCRRMILIAPGWPNMPWFWDLVNLSVQIPFRLPLIPDLVTQPFNGLLHRNLTQVNLHAWLLGSSPSKSTASLMRWQQEFEAPQRSSTRAVYKSKWSIFTKWCQSHEVDFRSPSVKQIVPLISF